MHHDYEVMAYTVGLYTHYIRSLRRAVSDMELEVAEHEQSLALMGVDYSKGAGSGPSRDKLPYGVIRLVQMRERLIAEHARCDADAAHARALRRGGPAAVREQGHGAQDGGARHGVAVLRDARGVAQGDAERPSRVNVSTFEHPNRAILVEQFSWAQAAAGIRSGLFHALQTTRKARIADECACLESRRTSRSPGFESPAFRHFRTTTEQRGAP